MATCRECTAPIIWAQEEDSGRSRTPVRVPLDDHEQRDYGPERYRIVRDGNPPIVARVADDSTVRTYVDHRQICREPRPI